MRYSVEEVMQYVEEEDVKFIRLAFCDIFGRQKNISIMPGELKRAFEYGIAFDASAIRGFGRYTRSDLFLHPDPDTLSVLPWRPEQGRVVRMYCTIKTPAGEPFECCTRTLLLNAAKTVANKSAELLFGSRAEFYLFGVDDNGNPTATPFDKAGYMDIAPLDRGENVRRQIALNLERMGIYTECSCHIEGSGQNAVKLVRTDIPRAADDLMSFFTVIKTAASANGLYAELSPKPLEDMPGSGLSIELSVGSGHERARAMKKLRHAAAGILAHLPEMMLFLAPTRASYERLRGVKQRALWFNETTDSVTLSAPDCTANPYLAFTLLINAALDGIKNGSEHDDGIVLPATFEEAVKYARESDFIRDSVPERITEIYCVSR